MLCADSEKSSRLKFGNRISGFFHFRILLTRYRFNQYLDPVPGQKISGHFPYRVNKCPTNIDPVTNIVPGQYFSGAPPKRGDRGKILTRVPGQYLSVWAAPIEIIAGERGVPEENNTGAENFRTAAWVRGGC